MSTPIALTIAGSDSSGGAGIQADLKTFSALGAYGASVITALTAQNTQAVTDIHPVPTAFIQSQIKTTCDDLTVNAVKIGMLGTPQITQAVAQGITQQNLAHIVLDPVMVAKSGDQLLQDDAIDALKTELIPMAEIITPNLPEAAVLTGMDHAQTRDEMINTAHALLDLGAKAVLLKGGHLSTEESGDLFTNGTTQTWLEAARIPTSNTHGTGCTLSSAIAAGLAKGLPLDEAVSQAKQYIHQAIRRADDLDIGHGHGPVHHFHRWW